MNMFLIERKCMLDGSKLTITWVELEFADEIVELNSNLYSISRLLQYFHLHIALYDYYSLGL